MTFKDVETRFALIKAYGVCSLNNYTYLLSNRNIQNFTKKKNNKDLTKNYPSVSHSKFSLLLLFNYLFEDLVKKIIYCENLISHYFLLSALFSCQCHHIQLMAINRLAFVSLSIVQIGLFYQPGGLVRAISAEKHRI